MHTVGTVALGAFVMTKRGEPGSVIAGYAIGNRLIAGGCADSTSVEPTEEALANALLWAGAPDLLDALNYLLLQTACINPTDGERDARTKALAAIEKATVAPEAKAAA